MTNDRWKFRAPLLLALPLGVACSGSSSGGAAAGQPTGGGGQWIGGAGRGGAGGTAGSEARGGGADIGGSSGVSGNGGAAGVSIGAGGAPYAYDPSIVFTWPKTSADGGAVSRCQSGHYVGSYSCNVTFGDAGTFNYPLTGPVDLRLAQAQNGEFLTVSGGTLASAAGFLAMNAALVGQLNCQSGAFAGTLQNGTLSIPPFPPGGTFSGSLEAGFVQSGPKLDGTWTLLGEGAFAGYVCHGPWTATWQPG